MAPNKLTQAQVYAYYKKHLEAGEVVTLRQAAADLGVSPTCVSDYVDELVIRKKLHKNTKRIYLREKDVIVKDQRGRYNRNKSAGAAKGGRAASMLLKKRAEELGIDRSAFARMPAADDQKVAERIDAIAKRCAGEGKLMRRQTVRAAGAKVG